MNILYICAECKPFSKMGGVGDVAGELPWALQEQGIDVEIVTPLYGSLDLQDNVCTLQCSYMFDFQGRNEVVEIYSCLVNGLNINFVKNVSYFEYGYSSVYVYSPQIPFYHDVQRFSFFSEVCLYLIKLKQPDIVHVNDWVLGYLLGRMVQEDLTPKRVLTVHNIGYQGNIGRQTIKGWETEKLLQDKRIGPLFIDPRLEWQSVNALKLGLELAHMVNTVSPTYCREITQLQDPDRFFPGAHGLHQTTAALYEQGILTGILNGFNYHSPPTDENFQQTLHQKLEMRKLLVKEFANQEAFLIGFVGRAVEQKLRLLTEKLQGKCVLEHILDLAHVNLVFQTKGLPEYENFLKRFEKRENFSLTIGFEGFRAEQITQGCDIFLMPSVYEPCGIAQMWSMSLATPPLVRWTGGLADTVVPHSSSYGTGFGFSGDTREQILQNFIQSVTEAANLFYGNQDKFLTLQRNAFRTRCLWSDTAKNYLTKLYQPFT